VAVEADLHVGRDRGADRLHALGGAGGQEGAGRVGDVDDLGARVGHDPGLLTDGIGTDQMGHHQEPDGGHADVSGQAEVLWGDVGFGAVGRHTDQLCAEVPGPQQIVLRADPRQQEDGQPARGEYVGGGGDQLQLVDQRQAVVERRTAEAVAVADLDPGDTGPVERGGHRPHLLGGEAVPLGVAAVAQRRVDDGDLGHATPSSRAVRASSSPTLVAAAVMMSRLPA
jgi:hypothetical protein